MQIINLTNNPVVLFKKNNKTKIFPVSGHVVKVKYNYITTREIFGDIPVFSRKIVTHANLPEFQDGIFYIVSYKVAIAYPERKDLIYTIRHVRDQNLKILGCRGFGKV